MQLYHPDWHLNHQQCHRLCLSASRQASYHSHWQAGEDQKMLLHWHWDWLIPWEIKEIPRIASFRMSVFDCGMKDCSFFARCPCFLPTLVPFSRWHICVQDRSTASRLSGYELVRVTKFSFVPRLRSSYFAPFAPLLEYPNQPKE